VERIGDEIDKRVDAKLGERREPPPAPPARTSSGTATVFMTLGSIALGLGATAIATSLGKNAASQVLMVLLIWVAIAVVNVAHGRRRG